MELLQYLKDDVCFVCKEAENSLHITKFCREQANQQWELSIEALKINRVDNNAPSSTVNAIVYYLH